MYIILLVNPNMISNKYFENHGITHKLLLVELEKMFHK